MRTTRVTLALAATSLVVIACNRPGLSARGAGDSQLRDFASTNGRSLAAAGSIDAAYAIAVDGRYITAEDCGSAALREGQRVMFTVGGGDSSEGGQGTGVLEARSNGLFFLQTEMMTTSFHSANAPGVVANDVKPGEPIASRWELRSFVASVCDIVFARKPSYPKSQYAMASARIVDLVGTTGGLAIAYKDALELKLTSETFRKAPVHLTLYFKKDAGLVAYDYTEGASVESNWVVRKNTHVRLYISDQIVSDLPSLGDSEAERARKAKRGRQLQACADLKGRLWDVNHCTYPTPEHGTREACTAAGNRVILTLGSAGEYVEECWAIRKLEVLVNDR